VVQLYAGAFFPGIMLAALYVGYVIVLARVKPALMPPLPPEEARVPLPAFAQRLSTRGRNAFTTLVGAAGGANADVPKRTVFGQLFVSLLPALVVAALLGVMYQAATAPVVEASTAGLVQAGGLVAADIKEESAGLIGAPPAEEEAKEDEAPQALSTPPGAEAPKEEAKAPAAAEAAPAQAKEAPPAERLPVPIWLWIVLAIAALTVAVIYRLWTWERLEVFKKLLASFFPLALLILAVLGSIVFGLATPTEAAAVGAFGGFILAAVYRYITHQRTAGKAQAVATTVRELGAIVKDSAFLTAKTSAMVCWLFVGSAIFSAAFALLGGQEIVEKWVLSLGLTPVQFMILAQFIIFILGWPLEWTEIIVIFMPIFIPLLPKFGIDPLFFGLLVALNLQTAFLSPPVAMAAFYLKGVSPPHVTLNQIFGGMLPFMGIQIVALALLYIFPGIGLWLPQTLYK
jgi:TRAP-type mannitol/chloroaromatic compound transport system permease large subunit